MVKAAVIGCALLGLALTGCVSPEEQRAMDQQTCMGYGFAPGTDSFANCMMATAQKRDEQQAAARRHQQMQDAIDAQRKATEAATAAAAANRPSPEPSRDSTGFPTITMPTMPSIDTSNCTRSATSSGNAGSMTMTCR